MRVLIRPCGNYGVNTGNEVYFAAKVHFGFVLISRLLSSHAIRGSTQAYLILVLCSRCAVLSRFEALQSSLCGLRALPPASP